MKRILLLFLMLILFMPSTFAAGGYIYENEKYHIKITFPERWSSAENPRNKSIAHFISPNGKTNIEIYAFPKSSTNILDTLIPKMPNEDDIEQENTGVMIISGNKAIWSLYSDTLRLDSSLEKQINDESTWAMITNSNNSILWKDYMLTYNFSGNIYIYRIDMFGKYFTLDSDRELLDKVLKSIIISER